MYRQAGRSFKWVQLIPSPGWPAHRAGTLEIVRNWKQTKNTRTGVSPGVPIWSLLLWLLASPCLHLLTAYLTPLKCSSPPERSLDCLSASPKFVFLFSSCFEGHSKHLFQLPLEAVPPTNSRLLSLRCHPRCTAVGHRFTICYNFTDITKPSWDYKNTGLAGRWWSW